MPGVCLSVCLSVCMSVCLLATSRKNYWTAIRENFTGDVSVCGQGRTDKILEVIHIRVSIQEFFEGFFNSVREGVFPTIWLISLEKLCGSSRKFYQRCIWLPKFYQFFLVTDDISGKISRISVQWTHVQCSLYVVVRLSVCRLSVTFVHPILSRLKFSAMFLRHLIRWGPDDIQVKF